MTEKNKKVLMPRSLPAFLFFFNFLGLLLLCAGGEFPYRIWSGIEGAVNLARRRRCSVHFKTGTYAGQIRKEAWKQLENLACDRLSSPLETRSRSMQGN